MGIGLGVVMRMLNIINWTCQLLGTRDLIPRGHIAMLPMNVIDRSVEVGNVSNMLFNFTELMFSFNVINWP